MIEDANTSDFVQVGRIQRSHGLDGELSIQFEDEYLDVVDNLNLVYLRNERGDFIPARILKLREEGIRSINSFFVQFEHIADRNAAERLKGQGIFLENSEIPVTGESAVSESELLDHEVLDEDDNAIGLVVDVMDNPAHPILVVATTSGTLLIPFVEQYVTEVRDQNIYCQNLEQLEGL